MNIAIEQLHLLLLNAGLAVHDGDWNWKNVKSPFMRLFFVTEGSAQIELPTGVYPLKPMCMYLIPAFITHSYICDSYFSHYYLHIYEEHRHEGSILDRWDFPFEVPTEEMDLSLIKRLCEINPHMILSQSDPALYDNTPTLTENISKNEQRTFYDKMESKGIVYQLLSRFIKRAKDKNKKIDARIEKITFYIHEHIYTNITIDELAEQIYLSKDHFIRLFKHETGTTPLRYINQKKIEKAQSILITNEIPVKNIAIMLGYENDSYFNQLFKKLTGYTPQEYRYFYH